MRKLTIFTALVGGAIAISACGTDTASNASNNANMGANRAANANTNVVAVNTNASNSNTATVQDNFWTSAARGGLAEVEMSKIAQTKATNAEVKKFAAMMVADHTKANNELKAAAAKQNVTLPTDISSSHRSTIEDLNSATGADFDKAYVEAMVDAHETDVSLFEDQAEDDDNADAKAFAAKTLPTLKKHLEMIKAIQAKLQ